MLKVHAVVPKGFAANCYIVSDGGEAFVVDPGGGAEELLAFLRDNRLAVRYIFLTHGHFDHIGALDAVRRATGAQAVIHKADAPYLANTRLNASFLSEGVVCAGADITVSGGETFLLGAHETGVLHTPGHTPGSVCLKIGTYLFTGDTLFEDDCGRCDFPGGSRAEMLRSLRLLASLPGDYTVLPGHDVSTTLDRERRVNADMLKALAQGDGQ
ncbi:MAG: MBL fold metallo-hydrolase [Oscillospiraceae bacterium]|jgi:glyoxylase-like metal-dependent hydrolase (beta-lactamase superfamily II)|nr:MBL fold metallo-hydrolase [Oscillospiraceae bacterium]